jgi:hypothetical protein
MLYRLSLIGTQTLESVMSEQAKVIAWRVEFKSGAVELRPFESGAIELQPAEEFTGMPGFGRWVTPLLAGGDTIDHCPDQAED